MNNQGIVGAATTGMLVLGSLSYLGSAAYESVETVAAWMDAPAFASELVQYLDRKRFNIPFADGYDNDRVTYSGETVRNARETLSGVIAELRSQRPDLEEVAGGLQEYLDRLPEGTGYSVGLYVANSPRERTGTRFGAPESL